MANGRTAKGLDSLVVLLFAIMSRLLFSIAICFDITSFAMLASHSEINCTSEQAGTGSFRVLNIVQFHNIASKSKRT